MTISQLSTQITFMIRVELSIALMVFGGVIWMVVTMWKFRDVLYQLRRENNRTRVEIGSVSRYILPPRQRPVSPAQGAPSSKDSPAPDDDQASGAASAGAASAGTAAAGAAGAPGSAA